MNIQIHSINANRQAINVAPNCWVLSVSTDVPTVSDAGRIDIHEELQKLVISSWDIKSIRYIGRYFHFDSDANISGYIQQFYIQFLDDASEAQFLIDKDKILGENVL